MDEEKTYHPAAHQRQPDEEAVAHKGAAAPEDAPRQEEVALAPVEEDGADWLYFIDHAATENGEVIAQALHMKELRQIADMDMRRFEEPRLAGVEVPAPHHQFEATPDVFFGAAGAQANANRHPIDGGETVTIRLEPRNKDAVILARQEMLAGASSSPAVLAGMPDVDDPQDNGWYDSVVHDAQRIEQMDDPELYDGGVPFQQQLPGSESPKEEVEDEPSYDYDRATNVEAGEFSLRNFTKIWGLHASDLDPDEPGPSTKRQMRRVPPLADHDVPSFDCGICIETLSVLDLFHGMQCGHRFCVECMATYIEGRIHSGEVPIPCPDPACKARDEDEYSSLHPEECKKSIDFAAFGSWGDRLAERAIPPDRRAYCPNRECGVMLETTGGKTPAMAFCPVCSHAMCATCGLDWSADGSGQHDCAEGAEVALVKKIAAERRWKQCPKCKMLVERTQGCRVMRCRCLFIFCYDCGRPLARGQEAGGETCQCDDRAVLQAHGFL